MALFVFNNCYYGFGSDRGKVLGAFDEIISKNCIHGESLFFKFAKYFFIVVLAIDSEGLLCASSFSAISLVL